MKLGGRLAAASSVAEIFELVKQAAQQYLGRDQAGLLVGFSDLGHYGHAFLGAFYSLDANTIIINKRPLQAIEKTNPKLYKPYMFHILLHEYLHSLGALEEEEVHMLAYEITKQFFGQNHLATQIALDMEKFLPHLRWEQEVEIQEDMNIEFVSGIDRRNTNYIM